MCYTVKCKGTLTTENARSVEHGDKRTNRAVCLLCSFLYITGTRIWREAELSLEQRLYEALQRNPIIAAVRDDEGLAQCLRTDIQTVFVLYGDICNIPEIVRQIKDAGKIAIVHADLIGGLAAKEISVDFLRRSTQADGVISTRANMIQRAKELNMIAILRVFLIDSMALDSALGAKNLKPDAIDILPGLMPSMLRKVRQMTGLPILTGGLITEKKEVMQALEAGALAISSTAPAVWEM